jgi:hypothetical protein
MDRHVHNFLFGLGLACALLFLLPVAALSAMLPIFTEVLVKGGNKGGLSSGLVYGVSTFGNIFGVMATAFVLIPRWPTSAILTGWAVAAAVCFFLFSRAVRVVAGRNAPAEAYQARPPGDLAAGG